MNGWWVSDYWNSPSFGPAFVVGWAVWVIGSIVLHELSHGWAALRLGDTTPRDLGHMTWNPLVHMGPWSLVAFAVVGIAWGMMPVDPSRLRGRHGDAVVAAAGPAMNIALGVVSAIGLVVWMVIGAGVGEPLRTNLAMFFRLGVILNIVLAVFNLLPVFPLDGGRIAASFSPAYARFAYGENGQWLMLGGFILFFMFGLDYVWLLAVLAADGVELIGAAVAP